MLTDFNLYMKSFSNFFMVTDNYDALPAKKKAMLQAVGGPDMVFLFDFIGKVPQDATYEAAIMTIRTGLTGHTNQAMMKFKLFTVIPQEGQHLQPHM